MADAYAFGLVKVDNEKAKDYYELGAMKGNPYARHNVGCMEEDAGNMERAIKHWMIALRDGYTDSLVAIQKLHSIGEATKEEYSKALRSYQVYLGEIKSVQRDKATAFDDTYKLSKANEDYKYY